MTIVVRNYSCSKNFRLKYLNMQKANRIALKKNMRAQMMLLYKTHLCHEAPGKPRMIREVECETLKHITCTACYSQIYKHIAFAHSHSFKRTFRA